MGTRTYDILVAGPDGQPTRQTVTEEVDDLILAADENFRALRDRSGQALAVNATFLANGSPTQAQVVQHVRALTRQSTALIRLMLGALDSTDGT